MRPAMPRRAANNHGGVGVAAQQTNGMATAVVTRNAPRANQGRNTVRGALAKGRAGVSFFADVEQAPPDAILGVTEAFLKDNSPDKLNLGVGAYRTEELKPLVLDVVKEAEKRIMSQANNKEYLAVQGFGPFLEATSRLLLGDNSKAIAEKRVVTLQSLSGTGSLRIGAAFLQKFRTGCTIYLSNPTWGNHKNIFSDAGLSVASYRYFDPKTVGLDFEGMKADLSAAPAGSVVVLHGCAHNPTGVDPTKEQWKEIAALCEEKDLFPFFDVAYQGFASGSLEEDAWAPRYFADEAGLEIIVSQSYSKNLGLYGERVGALNAVVSDPAEVPKVLSQWKRLARAVYSNPPTHGARIVTEVVSDPALFAQWKGEMETMSGRIIAVRKALQAALEARMPEKDWSFVTRQIGMFSFTGLSKEQVEHMWETYHVYCTKDGRLSLAGLPLARCEYLADAIVGALNAVPSTPKAKL